MLKQILMRSVLADRAMVIWVAAALLLWAACLTVLWGAVADTSTRSSLITLGGGLLAMAIAAQLPGRLVRLGQRMAGRFKAELSLAISLASNGPNAADPREARAVLRTLAAVAIFAVLCGGLSTAAIPLAVRLADAAAEAMLFSPTVWTAFSLVLATVGMLPMALGLATAFLATGMVRRGSGRDVYATVFREWLWALAIALVALAAAWRLGANLWGLSAGMAVALLMAAGVLFQRQQATVSPRQGDRPIENASSLRRAGVTVSFAVASAAIWLQLRVAGDAIHLFAPVALVWLAATLAMLAGFLRRMDHKSRPPGQRQRIGATLGVLAGLLMQAALLTTAIGGGRATSVCLVFAAIGQIPIAALAAVVISRQRRLFAEAGGRARSYFSAGAFGTAVGLLACIVALSCPYCPRLILVGSLAAAVAAVVVSVVLAREAREQLRWAATGVALIASLAGGLLAGMHTAGLSELRCGTWLTAAGATPRGARGVLPGLPLWRGAGVDRALAATMADHRGRWLVATVSCLDVPEPIDGVHMTVSTLEATLLGDCGAEAVGHEGDLLAAGRLARRKYDGICLALLPGDDSRAWRCYNDVAIRRQLRRLQDGGVAALRIQVREDGLANALAAMRTFTQAVGDCWVFAEGREDQIDLLIAGPAGRIEPPLAVGEAVFLTSIRLWYEWPRVRPLKLAAPGGVADVPADPEDFMARLRAIPGR